MKIRNGFVSNSSSSSFMMMYDDIKWDDIDINDINSEKIWCKLGYGEYGPNYFELSTEMFEWIKNNNGIRYNPEFFKVYFYTFDSGVLDADIHVPAGTKFICTTIDLHEISSVADLEELIEYL